MARPVHKGITPQRVEEAAFKIVDAEGDAALTMRRLGAELGVAAMAIYNHFADRDAILDAIAERALRELLIGSKAGSWRSRIRRLVAAVHALADEHPRIFAVIVNRPNRPRAFFPLMSESMDAFRQAGLSRKSAVQWYHTFLILIHGYATWRGALERYARLPPDPQDQAELTPDQLEDWRAVHSVSPKAQFDHAIDLLLKTLAAESGHDDSGTRKGASHV
jgi:AcrR family transcriptional regulator